VAWIDPTPVQQNDVLTSAQWNQDVVANTEALHKPSMCIVTRTAPLNHTTSGSYEAVTFDTETLDTDGMWESGTNPTRVTITTAGVYAVNFVAQVGAVVGTIATTIKKNGAFVAFLQSKDAHSATSYMTGTCYLALAANDYVEAFVYQESGGQVTMSGTMAVVWQGQAS
jgi:hypothetical protein